MYEVAPGVLTEHGKTKKCVLCGPAYRISSTS
jgi:hypothetical protein